MPDAKKPAVHSHRPSHFSESTSNLPSRATRVYLADLALLCWEVATTRNEAVAEIGMALIRRSDEKLARLAGVAPNKLPELAGLE